MESLNIISQTVIFIFLVILINQLTKRQTDEEKAKNEQLIIFAKLGILLSFIIVPLIFLFVSILMKTWLPLFLSLPACFGSGFMWVIAIKNTRSIPVMKKFEG